jgi:aspartate aminotransferase
MQNHERISAKLAKFRPSLTLALQGLVAARRAQGLPVYDFGMLDPAIRGAGEKAFREEATMYTDPAGILELREAVLRWLDVADRYGPENVVISTGAKQCLFNIFLAVCNPADCVLFDAAPWVSYQPLATAAYAFPVMVLPLGEKRTQLKVTPDDLRRNLRARPHAKLFLLNSPINPTGQLYTAAELEALLQVCVEHRIYFLLDRLYWRIVFDRQVYPEPRIDDETKPWLVQVDGMSKNFRRAGGLRIGWSVGPEDLTRAMVSLQSHYTSGPATPTQRAALAAITKPYDRGLAQELQHKRDLLHREAEGIPHLAIWPTAASFYSFWDITACLGRKTPDGEVLGSSDDMAAYLVKAGGVVTASGVGFMQDGFLRLSFATTEEDIVSGMLAARQAFEALQ